MAPKLTPEARPAHNADVEFQLSKSQRHAGTVLVNATPADKRAAELAALRFDYEQIDATHRQTVRAAAVEINFYQRRARKDMILIGQHLIEVKELLPTRLFGAWLQEEFELSARTAQNYMNVARVFGNIFGETVSFLSDSAAVALSAPNVPPMARQTALELVSEEQRVLGKAEAQRLILDYRGPAKTIDVRPTRPARLPVPDPVPVVVTAPAPEPEPEAATLEEQWITDLEGFKAVLRAIQDKYPDLVNYTAAVRSPINHLQIQLGKKVRR